MTRFVDIHALQNIAPSNLNRDDNGAPKTAIYGGVTRHRVSSQSWKKAIREHYNANYSDGNKGFRTKNIGLLLFNAIQKELAEQLVEDAPTEEEVTEAAVSALRELKIIGAKRSKSEPEEITSDALMLVSQVQINTVAHLITQALVNGTPLDDKEYKKSLKEAMKGRNSLALAMFGRMVASNTDLNVEAACQFAHAISTHAVSTEFDFFTAVDDFSTVDHAGSAMMGDIGFTSSTLYRYASINVEDLMDNFTQDVEVVAEAIANFIVSFTKAIPGGMQNTFATHTLPNVLLISIHEGQPHSFVSAFERPVQTDSGYAELSAKRLVEHVKNLESAYGTAGARFAVGLEQAERDLLAEVAGTGNLDYVVSEVKRILLSS